MDDVEDVQAAADELMVHWGSRELALMLAASRREVARLRGLYEPDDDEDVEDPWA